MNQEERLEIQAWLDGELPPARTAQITNLVKTDLEAKQLAAELRVVREALQEGEPQAILDEPREFYWSQIELQIEAEEPIPAVETTLTPSPVGRLMRWAVPAGSLAAILALIITFGTISKFTENDVKNFDTVIPDSSTPNEPTPAPNGHAETTPILEEETPNGGLEVYNFGDGIQNLTHPEDPNSLPESIENPDR